MPLRAVAARLPFDIVTKGIFELPKVEANTFAVGASVYYDAGNKLVTSDNDEGGNPLIDVAVTIADNPSASVNVKMG